MGLLSTLAKRFQVFEILNVLLLLLTLGVLQRLHGLERFNEALHLLSGIALLRLLLLSLSLGSVLRCLPRCKKPGHIDDVLFGGGRGIRFRNDTDVALTCPKRHVAEPELDKSLRRIVAHEWIDITFLDHDGHAIAERRLGVSQGRDVNLVRSLGRAD